MNARIRIIPRSEDDYPKIIHLFREEDVPDHTFPLPSERIHPVIREVPVTLNESEIKEKLQERGYALFTLCGLNGAALLCLWWW
nr:unnamed protein product [Callosobruchus analis]